MNLIQIPISCLKRGDIVYVKGYNAMYKCDYINTKKHIVRVLDKLEIFHPPIEGLEIGTEFALYSDSIGSTNIGKWYIDACDTDNRTEFGIYINTIYEVIKNDYKI